MRINGTKITFTSADSFFLEKFGLIQAGEMVMDFKTHNDLPFIYDTYQLAEFLSLHHKTLLEIFRKDKNQYYRKITLRKKNGGIRIINAPDELMKSVQNTINRNILSKIPVSQYAKAYKTGAKLYDNAKIHVGKKYLLKMDISDFFGSITFEQVYNNAFNTKFFPKQIGAFLTEFCCLNGVLPQGAPTSPAISNLVFKNFDNNIGLWCKNNGINYSRYCDDLTFSSDKPIYHVYEKVKKMLEEMGFELNEKKTRFVTNANRQSVTGLTVNEKVSVSREYKRKLRQDIYYILKFGENDKRVLEEQRRKLNADLSYTDYLNIIRGKINFVLSVEPENEYFVSALNKINAIID